MNKLCFLLAFLLISSSITGQIKMPSKQTPPRSTNSSAPKPSKKEEKQEKQEYRGAMLTLKLTSSVACKFYVDGEYKGIINPDQIVKIELKKGDYQFRAVNNENDLDVWQDLYNVAEVNTEKLFDVGVYLKEKIDQRVREEEAAALAKKLAEQAEINRLRKEEQDAKDKVEREKQYKEYLAKANEYYLDKSYANALENYQKALFLNPNSDEAKIGAAKIRQVTAEMSGNVKSLGVETMSIEESVKKDKLSSTQAPKQVDDMSMKKAPSITFVDKSQTNIVPIDGKMMAQKR